MNKKILGMLYTFAVLAVLAQPCAYSAGANIFAQHYDAAQSFLENGQYSSAIKEFRCALKINYLDNSARIGLINSYLSRAAYYANQEKKYENAANDFRSALFYLKMFPNKDQTVQNSAAMTASATENLNQCLKVTGFERSAASRFKKAEELQAIGNLSAAAYEFSKSAEDPKFAADSYTKIAELMKILGNVPKATEYYKKALDLNPKDGLLRMKYARTLDSLGLYDDAVPQYNAALANSKGDMEVLYSLERIYLKKLAQTPSDAELNANIGAIKQAQGDFDAALAYYAKAEQLNPNNINTRLNVGTLYQQKKDYQRALKSYDSVLTLYPDNVKANLYKAQALSEMGDKTKALELYKKVLVLEPSNAIAKSETLNLMRSTMSPEEFIAYLSKRAGNDKNMQGMLYEYAYKLHKDNKTKEAISAYKSYIDLNPSNPDAYLNLGICYASIDDYESALAVLNTAKNKFPSNNLIAKTLKDIQKDCSSQAIANAASSLESKDYQKALNLYLGIKPATEDSLLGVAAAYQGLGNTDKAIEYYKKAFEINPKNSEIPYYIGYLYTEQQKWAEASNFLNKALSLNPQSEAKNLLSYVAQNQSAVELTEGIKMFENKNLEGALKKFTELIKKDPDNANAYYYRALIYDEQKKNNLAVSDYLSVLKYTKELPIVNYLLAVDYDGLENYKDAYKYYNQFISAYSTDDECLKYAKSRVEELKPYIGG